MKKQRRVIAIAMSSAMALTALAGCAGGTEKDETTQATTAEQTTQATEAETTPAQTEQVTTAPTETTTEAPTDRGIPGPYIIDTRRDVTFVTQRKAVPDGTWRDALLLSNGLLEPTNTYQEDLRDWMNFIEEEYNIHVHITNITRDGSDYASMLASSIIAGDPIGQLLEIDARWLPALLNSRMLAPLEELPSLDLTEEKWNQNVIKATTFAGHIYGINADRDCGYGVFFNKQILQEVGYSADDLYDLQKNGEWNHTKFEEILKACTKDTNGDNANDLWGMTTSLGAHYYTAMVYASGADFVTKDASGQFVNQMGSEDFLSAVSWADELWKKYAAPPMEVDGELSFIDRFNKGEVAMLVASEKDKSLLTLDDGCGFVTIPCPDGREVITVDPSPVVFISASYSKEEANEIAFALDLITDDVPGFCEGRYEQWKEEYYGSYTNNRRAVDETLQLMKYGKNSKVRLELYVKDLYDKGIMQDLFSPLFGGTITPQEAIQEKMDSWNAYIEEQNEVLKILPLN